MDRGVLVSFIRRSKRERPCPPSPCASFRRRRHLADRFSGPRPDPRVEPYDIHTSFGGREPLDRRLASPPPLWGRDRWGVALTSRLGGRQRRTFEARRNPPPQSSPTRGEEAAPRPPGMAAGSRERCVNHVGSSPGMPKGALLNANVAAPAGDGLPLATL